MKLDLDGFSYADLNLIAGAVAELRQVRFNEGKVQV